MIELFRSFFGGIRGQQKVLLKLTDLKQLHEPFRFHFLPDFSPKKALNFSNLYLGGQNCLCCMLNAFNHKKCTYSHTGYPITKCNFPNSLCVDIFRHFELFSWSHSSRTFDTQMLIEIFGKLTFFSFEYDFSSILFTDNHYLCEVNKGLM